MTMNSASSSVQAGNSKIAKEFSEKWLQALSLSAAHPAAQRIKPMLNDIDSICMQRSQPEQLEAAKRLWEYAESAGLRPLLVATPYQRAEWRFDDDEDEAFVFERTDTVQTKTLEAWLQSLGLQPHTLGMTAIINQEDWSQLIRNEAIRMGRPLKVTGSPAAKESLLWLNCTAEWDRADWSFRFADPDWIVKKFEGAFIVSRPSWNEIEGSVLGAVDFAIKNLAKATSPASNVALVEETWMQSLPSLLPLHRSMIEKQRSSTPSPWFYRVWANVWPVIYREQNRLRGPCDLDAIRRELELCFRNVPQLVVWTFALGKLICQYQLGRGLGICGEFK